MQFVWTPPGHPPVRCNSTPQMCRRKRLSLCASWPSPTSSTQLWVLRPPTMLWRLMSPRQTSLPACATPALSQYSIMARSPSMVIATSSPWASASPVGHCVNSSTVVVASPRRKPSSWVSTPAVALMQPLSRASPTETFVRHVWCLVSTVVFVLLVSERHCARSTHLA